MHSFPPSIFLQFLVTIFEKGRDKCPGLPLSGDGFNCRLTRGCTPQSSRLTVIPTVLWRTLIGCCLSGDGFNCRLVIGKREMSRETENESGKKPPYMLQGRFLCFFIIFVGIGWGELGGIERVLGDD